MICRNCGINYPDYAVRCPRCGAPSVNNIAPPVPQKNNNLKIILASFVALLLVAAIVSGGIFCCYKIKGKDKPDNNTQYTTNAESSVDNDDFDEEAYFDNCPDEELKSSIKNVLDYNGFFWTAFSCKFEEKTLDDILSQIDNYAIAGLYETYWSDIEYTEWSEDTGYYYIFDADNMEWLLNNVLNLKDVGKKKEGHDYYYKGDKIYIRAVDGGGAGYVYTINEMYKTKDGKYIINTTQTWDNGEPDADKRAIAFIAKPRFDNNVGIYWSFYEEQQGKKISKASGEKKATKKSKSKKSTTKAKSKAISGTSKDALEKLIKQKASNVQQIYYEDFDGDGVYEAFALCAKKSTTYDGEDCYTDAEVWYICKDDAYKVASLEFDVFTKDIITAGNYKFVVFECMPGGPRSDSRIFGVNSSLPYEPKPSGKVSFFCQEDGKITGCLDDYDPGYHEFKYYEYKFNENTHDFDRGKLVKKY